MSVITDPMLVPTMDEFLDFIRERRAQYEAEQRRIAAALEELDLIGGKAGEASPTPSP